MLFGTTTDETTSFTILDRFIEAGGSLIDTANNYAYWVNGTQGGERGAAWPLAPKSRRWG
ncbi:hypothetical protein [Nonomuraea sp. 10N515B]|uniref:hypothetical protein n=1 Tax=Nonomuraea sp. 10N515B TaxID=3457422 RepID=UPI003FCCCE6E